MAVLGVRMDSKFFSVLNLWMGNLKGQWERAYKSLLGYIGLSLLHRVGDLYALSALLPGCPEICGSIGGI